MLSPSSILQISVYNSFISMDKKNIAESVTNSIHTQLLMTGASFFF